MRLAYVEADRTFLAADGFDAGQRSPQFRSLTVRVAADFELDYVMAAEAVDQIGRSAFGDDLAVIDDGKAVAEALGFVHVVRGEQDGATFLLEGADDVPELAAALGIEAGGWLVEKEDARIADERGGYGEALFLTAGKLADPGVGFFRELEFFEDFVDGRGSL